MFSPRQLLRLRTRDLNQLVALAALLRSASVTEAANAMEISQPAMSKILFRMRQLFEDQLLVREGNRMMLTPKAQALLISIDAAMESLDQVYAARETFDPAAISRHIRIAANDHLQQLFAAPLYALLTKLAPNITIEFGPVGMLEPQHLLSKGIVDLIIGISQYSSDLRSMHLYEDEFVCIAGSGNLSCPDVLDLHNFSSREHLDVSPSGLGMLRAAHDQCVRALGGQRRVVASISTFLGVPGILAQSNLLALVPKRSLACMPVGSVRVLQLDFPLSTYSVSMWWHNSTHGDPLNRWLREKIAEVSKQF
jgi:DNA-binding transcriptional LysR family regulator